MNYREFRNRFRLIPFGKFSISGRGKSPYNQIYVGRKKERASFIELLTHQEQFGSFLVSGRRGSGKTSFVNYALSEYEQSSFHRFIRFARNSGVQDLFVALLICILISTLLVLTSQLGSLLTQNAHLSLRDDFQVFDRLHWVWVPLVLIATLSFGLILYAIQGINAAAQISRGWIGKIAMWGMSGFFFGLLFLGLVFSYSFNLFPTFQDKLATFSGFNGGLKACILALFSIANINILFGITKIKRKYIKYYPSIQILSSFIYFLVLIIFVSSKKYNFTELNNIESYYNLFIFIAVMYISNFIASVKNNTFKFNSKTFTPDIILFLIIFIFNIALIIINYSIISSTFVMIIIFPLIFSTFASFWWLLDNKNKAENSTISPDTSDMDENKYLNQYIFANRPPVELVLIVKSSFILLLAVTLLIPFVIMLKANIWPESQIINSNNLAPLFHLSGTDILPIALFLVAMFFYEYEWISRSMRTERQDSSIAPLGRKDSHAQLHELWPKRSFSSNSDATKPSWADHTDKNSLDIEEADTIKPWLRRRAIARNLEKSSLPYLFYNSRVPVILTWINLGFDDLRHSRIIEAMLVQLRTQYREKFTSLSSQIGLATMIVTIILVLFLSKLFAFTLFHIGPVNLVYDRIIVENQVNAKPVYGATNYCGFFERHPETAPAVKNAICLLPYSDRLFEFLYSRVLDLSVDFEAIGSDTNSILQIKIWLSQLNDIKCC